MNEELSDADLENIVAGKHRPQGPVSATATGSPSPAVSAFSPSLGWSFSPPARVQWSVPLAVPGVPLSVPSVPTIPGPLVVPFGEC